MTTTNLPVVQDGKRGRPKYSDAVRKKVIAGLKTGMTRVAASGWAGIARTTLFDWIEKDEAFREAVLEAEAFAEARYTATISALTGTATPPATRFRASAFWLERRRPQEWRERTTVDLNLPPEAEEAKRAVDDLRDELHALGEELLRRGSDRSG